MPDAFISAATAHAKEFRLAGYNLDFEPYGQPGVTNADGTRYADFVAKFARALHSEGMELSVDYFSNLGIWNLPALNDTGVDTLISMDTYVQRNATMEFATQVALGHIESSRLGVGICPQPSTTQKPYGPDPCGPLVWSSEMIAERLGYLGTLMANPATSFRMINFCCTGEISDAWWTGLQSFYSNLDR